MGAFGFLYHGISPTLFFGYHAHRGIYVLRNLVCPRCRIDRNHFKEPLFWFISTKKVVYVLTKKQFNLFKVFARTPFAELTRPEIKRLAREKSNNALAEAIGQFLREKLIIERKVGRSSLFWLNLDQVLTCHYLTLSNNQSVDKQVRRSLDILIDSLDQVSAFYGLVVFGSYAADSHEPGSDLDVAVLIENAEMENRYKASLHDAQLKSLIHLDVQIIIKNEFLEMLASAEENLAKQIVEKHLAIHNVHIFYGLIKEAVRHGFNPETLSRAGQK